MSYHTKIKSRDLDMGGFKRAGQIGHTPFFLIWVTLKTCPEGKIIGNFKTYSLDQEATFLQKKQNSLMFSLTQIIKYLKVYFSSYKMTFNIHY